MNTTPKNDIPPDMDNRSSNRCSGSSSLITNISQPSFHYGRSIPRRRYRLHRQRTGKNSLLLDKLASEGVLFTNAVSSYPVSSPARAMLMTGMYPIHNKVTGNCNSQTAPYGVELSQDARCWSDVLKDMNYQTGYIGKMASGFSI